MLQSYRRLGDEAVVNVARLEKLLDGAEIQKRTEFRRDIIDKIICNLAYE
jgi:hypothetical protein